MENDTLAKVRPGRTMRMRDLIRSALAPSGVTAVIRALRCRRLCNVDQIERGGRCLDDARGSTFDTLSPPIDRNTAAESQLGYNRVCWSLLG